MILGRSDSVISAVPPETIPVVIILVSIVAFTIIIERMIFFWNIRKLTQEEITLIKNLLRSNQPEEAVMYAQKIPSPVSKVLAFGIESRIRGNSIDNEFLDESYRQVSIMEKFLNGLGTIATIAPLLGVLGTVLGIIRSFEAGAGTKGAEVGISEALITTAMGLAVAIPAYIFYNYFINKKDSFIGEIENVTSQISSLLSK